MGELSIIAEKKGVLRTKGGFKSSARVARSTFATDDKRRSLEKKRLPKVPDAGGTGPTKKIKDQNNASSKSEEKVCGGENQQKDVSPNVVGSYDIRTSMKSFGGDDVDWSLMGDFDWNQQKAYSSEYSLNSSVRKEPWFRKYNIDRLRREYIWLKNLCSRPVKEICFQPVSDPEAPLVNPRRNSGGTLPSFGEIALRRARHENTANGVELKLLPTADKSFIGIQDRSITTELKPGNRNAFLYISAYNHSEYDLRHDSFSDDMERERIRLPRLTKNKANLVSSNSLRGEYEKKGRHRRRSQERHSSSIPMIYPKAFASVTLPHAPPNSPDPYDSRFPRSEDRPRYPPFLQPIKETNRGQDYNFRPRLQKLPLITSRKRAERITVHLPVCDQLQELENNDKAKQRDELRSQNRRLVESKLWCGPESWETHHDQNRQLDDTGRITQISSSSNLSKYSDKLLRYNVYNPSREDLGDDSSDASESTTEGEGDGSRAMKQSEQKRKAPDR